MVGSVRDFVEAQMGGQQDRLGKKRMGIVRSPAWSYQLGLENGCVCFVLLVFF